MILMTRATKAPTEVRTNSVASLRASYGLSRSAFRRILGVSARAMCELERDRLAISATLARRFGDAQRLFDVLVSLMEREDIRAWLRAPSSYMDGDAPLELLERDEIDRVWHLVYALSSGEPRG